MDTLTISEPPRPRPRHSRWRPGTVIAVSVLLAALLAARVAAPHVVRDAIDRRLNEIPGYSGHVEGVALHVWRGAYRIDGMRIVRESGRVREPFLSADRIDFSVDWREVFRGRFVSQIYVRNGRLVFVRGPDEASSQLAADSRWRSVINDLFPIDITLLDIKGGVLRFVDTTHSPRVDIAVRDLTVIATGLQNRPTGAADPFPAKVDVSGTTIGNGRLRLFTRLEPLAHRPHFDLNLELKQVSLPTLNNFLEAYADVEVARCQLDVFAQMEMEDGHYVGYVKPFLSGLSFADVKGENKSLGHRLWKALVAGAADLARNSETNQVATRIPFSGEASDLDVRAWRSIENGLYNGFVKAFPKGFEGTPNPDRIAAPGTGPAGKPEQPKS